ncbi:TPA: MFS transporter [Staphylococcus aureus]|nr:MFS transporter [Staphylococcus aureus]
MNKVDSKLPLIKLLAFSLISFICVMTETLPSGLLPEISEDLNVPNSYAGQLVTFYALGSFISPVPIVLKTQSWNRKPLFLFGLLLFFLMNTITVFSLSYILTLACRFVAGIGSGLIWSLLAGYISRMVTPDVRGRALTIAMLGTPIALSIGMPVGSYLGVLLNWRIIFLILSILIILLIFFFIVQIPNFKGNESRQKTNLVNVVKIPGVISILIISTSWIVAHSILYTYITTYIKALDISVSISMTLFIFGLFSIVSILLTGVFIDSYLIKLIIISLVLFFFASLILTFFQTDFLVIIAIIFWGLSFGGAATLVQSILSKIVERSKIDTAMAISATSWNLSIASGGFIGGMLLKTLGTESFTIVMLVLIVMALLTINLKFKQLTKECN